MDYLVWLALQVLGELKWDGVCGHYGDPGNQTCIVE
jgi:hypothetical protein